jgi:hypothetical protein
MDFAEGTLAPPAAGGSGGAGASEGAAGGGGLGGQGGGGSGLGGLGGQGGGGSGLGGFGGQGGTAVGPGCDPLNPSSMCNNEHCVPQLCPSSEPQCRDPGGPGTQDDSCSQRGGCAAIFECVNTGLGGHCLQWCRLGLDDCAGLGSQYTCTGLSPAVCIGAQQWGVCN